MSKFMVYLRDENNNSLKKEISAINSSVIKENLCVSGYRIVLIEELYF